MNTTRNLSLLGLGVDGDVQPDDRYPELTPGNHLRWAFASHRGFPRDGYYLLRREHEGPWADPILLTDALPEKVQRGGFEETFSTDDGHTFEFSDSSLYEFRDGYDLHGDRTFGYGSDGRWEFRFHTGFVQTIALPQTAYRVECSLAIEGDGSVTVAALAGDRVVAEETVTESGVVTLQADHFETVRIGGASLSLVELACFSLLAEATTGWELLEDAPAPITLPLSHPDYPAAQGAENLPAARTTARDRVSYGEPERFAPDAATVESDGTVTVENGSAIVTGDATDWTPDLAGSVFGRPADDTGYVVAQVLEHDRLVLGRPYEGASATNSTYELAADSFGQLHDYLAHLVDDGSTAGGMSSRIVPQPTDEAGTLRREANSSVVTGTGTNWTDDLEGLTLRVGRNVSGTVSVMHGMPIVVSQSAYWDESMIGDRFHVADEREWYTITDVRSTAYGGSVLSIMSLDRPISGPHYPSQGLDYDVFESEGVEVANVYAPTKLRLAHPHRGPDDWTDREYVIEPSLSAPGPTDENVPSAPFQYPMDLALLASVDPAFAQLLGLYWIDETADPGQSYDYLVVADHGYQAYRERIPTTTRLESGGPPLASMFVDPRVDWDVAFDVQPGDAGTLDAPTDAEAYSLPPIANRSDVGLRWHQDDEPTKPDPAGLYYLWRRDCGSDPPDAPPAPADYDVLTRDGTSADESFMASAEPIPRTRDGDDPPVQLPGWPSERMHTVDTNLADGWYSYRLTAMDLFGRHSPPGDPATWTDADGDPHAHPAADRAVEVAADLPPPPPSAVEASALDPDDPYVRQDDPYETWRADNEGEVGLRVRWAWSEDHAESAPDVEGFQVHFQPGRLNAEVGDIIDVASTSDGYRIDTDLETSAADDEFAGATLQVNARGFPIVASGGDPLWVEVEPADPTADTAVTDGGTPGGGLDLDGIPNDPLDGGTIDDDNLTITFAPISPGDECTIAIPPVYDRGTVTLDGDVVTAGGAERAVVRGTDTGWSTALEGQEFRTVDDVAAYEVYRVDSPTKLLLDRVYDPPDGLPAKHRTYAIGHPAGTDYTDVGNWSRHIDTVRYADELDTDEDWPRVYETFVTLADTDGFEPSVTDPKVFANASVTAVDAADQDGPVAAPAKVARVYRETPDPPAIPVIDADFEWASEADYHGKSRYTVRWEKPGSGLQTHVFRALDETLFGTDWERRKTVVDDDSVDDPHAILDLSADDLDRFPETLCPDDGDSQSTRDSKRVSRETIATELNRLTGLVESGEKDAAMAFYRSLRNPENDTDDVEKLKPAMARVLAGLPGNESAYTQMTVEALDPDETPNKPGPDTGPGESYPQGDLCAYVDSFDGRSSNCYFYRTGTVDPAGNRSDQREAGDGETLSYPTPGVKAPDVVGPKKPVVTKILAGHPDEDESGDRMITAWLASTTERDVVGYRVYRTDKKDTTRDLRLMDEVADDVAVAETGETIWTDEGVEPFTSQYYRFVAVDEAGNRSDPSSVVSARAFDDSRPDPPTWDSASVDSDTGMATLSWTLADTGHRPLLQRSPPDEDNWTNVTGWLAQGTREAFDTGRDTDDQFEYRLLVVATDGRQNDRYNRRTI